MTTPTPDGRRTLVDPRVDAAWREVSREEPAASVDAALLAAARREVGAKPQSVDAREARAARRRWWPLAAAATVAAIAVGVLQLATPDHIGAPTADNAIVSDMPAASSAGGAAMPRSVDQVSPPAVAPAPPVVDTKPGGGDEARVRSETSRMDASPRPAPVASASEPKRQAPAAIPISPPVPEPFPGAPKAAAEASVPAAATPIAAAPPAPVVAPPAEPASRKEQPSSRAAAGNLSAERASLAPAPLAKMAANAPTDRVTSGAADAGAADVRIKDRAPLPVPEWITLIRRLRDEGKTADAAKELAAFRAAHADHEKLLPPDLRDWHPPPN